MPQLVWDLRGGDMIVGTTGTDLERLHGGPPSVLCGVIPFAGLPSKQCPFCTVREYPDGTTTLTITGCGWLPPPQQADDLAQLLAEAASD